MAGGGNVIGQSALKELLRRFMRMERQIKDVERRLPEVKPFDMQAWGAACSSLLALPGLRGCWPMSASDVTGRVADISGHGNHLSYNGNPTYNAGGSNYLAPYLDFDGIGDYVTHADASDFDITGGETSIVAGLRGLTLGGWFKRDTAQTQGLIGKAWNGNYSYRLWETTTADEIRFGVWDTGSTNYAVSADSAGIDTWEFIAGRFKVNDIGYEDLAIMIDGEITEQSAGASFTIRDQSADFAIGRTGAYYLDGQASLCFLCAAAIPDDVLYRLFYQTRGLFYG